MSSPNPGTQRRPATAERRPLQLSRLERGALYVVMLLSPVLLLALVETGLRVVGYGSDYPLFVPVEGREEYLFQNREVARRYFANLETLPTSLLDFFPREKREGTFRVFVQGGSSAAGFPFYYGGAFSRMLEQRLAQTYPEHRIEMVNTAMAAVNSFTMLDLVPEILEHAPDAVLIYAGHNEFYGALGVGSSESLGRSAALKRLYLRLRRLRTVQALRSLIVRSAALFGGRGSGDVPHWTMMSRMVGEQRIKLDSPLFNAGLQQFESNLERILSAYSRRGIPVFVATLASNEGDHRPFIGDPEGEARIAYAEGIRMLGDGRLGSARAAFERSVAIDSLAADPFFALGKIHQQENRYADARVAYLAAKDRDELRFRAPEAFNEIIRRLAGRHAATVVEAQDAFREKSPNAIIGNSLMTEHLHPNVDGYFLLADAFYDVLLSADVIPAVSSPVSDEAARREVLLTAVDSLAGMLRIQRLKAAWPFQPPGVVDRSMDSLRATNEIEQIAMDLVADRVNWLQANNAVRIYYEQRGDLHRALQAALAQIQEFPFIGEPYLHAGNLLVRQRRYSEAMAYFENALEVQESALAHRMIGSILLERGSRQEAIRHLERAVALNSADVPALYNLAGAYALERRFGEARQYAERALAVNPSYADARRLLESLPEP